MRRSSVRIQLSLSDSELAELGRVKVTIPASSPCTCSVEPAGFSFSVVPPSSELDIEVSDVIFVDARVDGEQVTRRMVCPMFFDGRGFVIELPPESAIDASNISARAEDVLGAKKDWVEVFGDDCVIGGAWRETAFVEGRCCFSVEVLSPSQLTLDLSSVGPSALEDPEEDWISGPAALSFQFSENGDWCSVYADKVDRHGQRDPTAREKIGFFNWKKGAPIVVEVSVVEGLGSFAIKTCVSSSGSTTSLRSFSIGSRIVRSRIRETGFSGKIGAYKLIDVLDPRSTNAAKKTVIDAMRVDS